jgi:hypothetical protein
MSREQGPCEAGMRPAAIAAGRRPWLRSKHDNRTEAARMSREQGPPKGGRGAPARAGDLTPEAAA